jgi:hypothetical protein
MVRFEGAAMWGVVVVFAGFLFEWLAIIFKWHRIKPYSKVLAMVILIFWTLFMFEFKFTPLVTLLFAAQIFGLAGDIFLLYSERWFLWGLGAFLAGHVFYLILIVNILIDGIRRDDSSFIRFGVWFVVGLTIFVFILLFYKAIVTVLLQKQPGKPFVISLFVYAFILTSVMVLSYLTVIIRFGESWIPWLLSIGGTLFFISDFTLAYDRFVKRLANGQLGVMITYLLGQFFLAYGFIGLILRG